MKIFTLMLFAALSALPVSAWAQWQTGEEVSPRWNVKTNLLYDATATLNLGAEFRIGPRTSLDIPLSINAWSVQDGRQWKHVLFQPEYRMWAEETFLGHFLGLHGHLASYNLGHLPFSQFMKANRLDGWLTGLGVSYGYRWGVSERMALEATVGLGYAYMSHDRHPDGAPAGRSIGEAKHYFGPTKLGLSLIFDLGGSKANNVRKEIIALNYNPNYVPKTQTQPQPQPETQFRPQLPPKPQTQELQPEIIHDPVFAPSFLTPEQEAVKIRTESGKAYLDFKALRSEIVPDYMNNAAELQKMHKMIEAIRNNPDATLTGISITGYASPEGSFEENIELSESRAQELKNLVRAVYGMSDAQITAKGMGEDWTGLEILAEQSDVPQKERVLEIIRGENIYGGRKDNLLYFSRGEPYQYLCAMVFPKLRRVEYQLHYTLTSLSAEEGQDMLGTRPDNLSLGEMYMVADMYRAGSAAANEVYETAARLFPDSDVANMNAAASALLRRDAASAAYYLDMVAEHSTAYWNNMGVLSWLEGDRVKAAGYFVRGGAQGVTNAAELARHME